MTDIDKKYNIRRFQQAPELKTPLENVLQLDAIDLTKFHDGPEGFQLRKLLAQQLEKTISTVGFFNVVNFGYPEEKLEYLKAISQSLLETPDLEQRKFYSGAATAEEDLENKKKGLGAERGEGFKPKGFWKLKDNVRDSIVHFNFRDAKLKKVFEEKAEKGRYPEVFAAHVEEFHHYYHYLHTVVLRKILILCDIILRLEEGTLYERFFKLDPNSVENSSGGHGRAMLYHPVTDIDQAQKADGTWLRGHSDISAFSIITSQPILSLQIKDFNTGEWKYIGYRPNSLVFNVGDGLEFLTGGYFKASIHRVVLPPLEQREYKRLVLIDFVNPTENTVVHPSVLDSPRLRELGLAERNEWDKITYSEWDSVKGKLLGADNVSDRSLLKYYGRNIERWHHNQVNPV